MIRVLNGNDDAGISRLAQRDSAEAPPAPLLGASIDGELVAALSLSSGDLIADPFVRTNELAALLSAHAARLNGGSERRGRLGFLHRRSRGALPASPPGAGGRLLALARRS